MSINEIAAVVSDLQELVRMAEEVNAEIESKKDQVKAYMGDSELLVAGPYKVTYKAVTSSRLDTTALKKALPDIAAQYTKTTTTRRFTVQ
jgi:predicted phage-related endonuclease